MRHPTRTFGRALCLTGAFALSGVALTACDDGAAEEAGETIDDAADDTLDAIDDAADDLDDAVDDATDGG